MAKIAYRTDLDTTGVKVATVNQSVVDSINAGNGLSYEKGRYYYLPSQKAHSVEVTYNGEKYNSNRFFAIEMVPDGAKFRPTGMFTAIRLNNIRQSYFGEVGVDAFPAIPTYTDENGRLRMKTDRSMYKQAVTGSKGIAAEGNTPVIRAGVLYQYKGTIQGYTPKFEDRHIIADGDGNLELEQSNVNLFEASSPDEQSFPGLTDILGVEKAKEFAY